jgi:CheY-like chemotaxis protein
MTAPRIAVVEDNADNRLLLQALLGDDYELAEFGNGRDALDALGREPPPQLVLLDISLPEMSGVEVLRRIRADPRLAGLPVIALTAHAMAGDRESYLAAGFDDYVSKPIVDEGMLRRAIERWIRRPGA